MPSRKDHCACGSLKNAQSKTCRRCWKVEAKESSTPIRCTCGSIKQAKARSCRVCYLTDERVHPKRLCSCGGRKAKRSENCRKCWLQSRADEALRLRQQPERCCTKCRNILPVADFVKDGEQRTARCKTCQRAFRKTRAGFWIKLRHRLRKQFGITVDDYMTLWNLQGGRCAVCFERLELHDKDTHLDHCHSSGQIRGLLCRRCNHAAGFANDSPSTLRRLAAYLEQFSRDF
jgi:hypothetical protein